MTMLSLSTSCDHNLAIIIDLFLLAFALVGASMAQRGGRRSQRPRGGRDGTGYAAPAASDNSYAAPDAQPAYGGDQDVYQVND